MDHNRMKAELRIYGLLMGVTQESLIPFQTEVYSRMRKLLIQESVEYILPDPGLKRDEERLEIYLPHVLGAFSMFVAYELSDMPKESLKDFIQECGFSPRELEKLGVFEDVDHASIHLARLARGIEVAFGTLGDDALEDLSTIAALGVKIRERKYGKSHE